MAESSSSAEEPNKTRLFVGKLSGDADQQNLRERFQQYGVVQQINLFRGYAFVHYDAEQSAADAIAGENGNEFLGAAITVSLARPTKKKPQVNYEEIQKKEAEKERHRQMQREQAALANRGGGGQRGRGGRGRGGRGGARGRGRGGGGGGGGGGHDAQYEIPVQYGYGARGGYDDGYEEPQHQSHGYRVGHPPDPRDVAPGRDGRQFDDYYEGQHHRDRSRDAEGRERHGSAGSGGQARREKKRECDCEIICVDRGCRRYCEFVEKRLRNLGMDVDILFPNPDIPAHKILANVRNRGVRFAAVATTACEETRTLTVHVLQGPQQAEYSALELDEALHRLAKAFESALDTEAKVGKVAPGEQHPRDVLSVITFLRENRPLSVMEFDRLIKYLVHRREQMLRAEYGDAIPAHLAVPPLGPQSDPASRVREEALRKRVFGLLTAPPPRDILNPEPSSSYASHGPVDPTLQKAIDSLISSGPNLLSGDY